MRWSRPEQLLVLFAVAAVVLGAGALFAARRPPSAVRIFEAPASPELVVQVDGAVLRPGLYHLEPGARAADAITAAGGPAAAADLTLLNQARLLRDGERVTVPRRSAIGPTPPATDATDINAADTAALEHLPGIGPVLARRIVAYRDRHGPFHRLEDLLQVEGIGPRLLDRLRGRVVIR